MAMNMIKVETILGMLTIRLQEDNFVKWSFQFRSVLEGNDMFDHFDGTSVCPPKFVFAKDNGITTEVTVAYKEWIKRDRALVSLLLATLGDEAIEYVVGCKTAHEAWMNLQDRYATISRARVNHLKTELLTIKKGSDSVEKYMLRIKVLKDLAAGEVVSDNDLIVATLVGLPAKFNMIRTLCIAKVNLQMLIHHRVKDRLNNFLVVMQNNANSKNNRSYQNYGGNNGRFNNRPRYNGNNNGRFSGNSNFFARSTSNNGNFNFGFKGGSTWQNWNGNTGSRTTLILECQICNKRGHTAPNCYSRITVGNGEGLPVANTGLGSLLTSSKPLTLQMDKATKKIQMRGRSRSSSSDLLGHPTNEVQLKMLKDSHISVSLDKSPQLCSACIRVSGSGLLPLQATTLHQTSSSPRLPVYNPSQIQVTSNSEDLSPNVCSTYDNMVVTSSISLDDVADIHESSEPTHYKQVVTSENWRNAMKEEFEALQKQGTWELVPVPQNRNVIGSKWVYKIKKDQDGKVSRYKAPRAWNAKFTSYLPTLGFQSSHSDPSLFVKINGFDVVILLLPCSTPSKRHTQLLKDEGKPMANSLQKFGTLQCGLTNSAQGQMKLLGYSDSKKQGSVSRSSTEAEYKALANAVADIKHLDTDFHFVREKVQNGDLAVQYIPTEAQVADVLTKGIYITVKMSNYENILKLLGCCFEVPAPVMVHAYAAKRVLNGDGSLRGDSEDHLNNPAEGSRRRKL
ncbi:uncharacterized protein [Malus domestica]|uniref:uncharacterized protein n=1 Tax=Malus domestica TaxID=3750 RepID=UPI00397568CA